MQSFKVYAEAHKDDGSYVINPDGSTCSRSEVVQAGSAAIAAQHVVGKMGSRFDKVMKCYYMARPKLAVGDTLTVKVIRQG